MLRAGYCEYAAKYKSYALTHVFLYQYPELAEIGKSFRVYQHRLAGIGRTERLGKQVRKFNLVNNDLHYGICLMMGMLSWNLTAWAAILTDFAPV